MFLIILLWIVTQSMYLTRYAKAPSIPLMHADFQLDVFFAVALFVTISNWTTTEEKGQINRMGE